MLEEARKLSKLFFSLERLADFLRRDFVAQFQQLGPVTPVDYESYVQKKIDEVEDMLRKLRRGTFLLGTEDFNHQKQTLYMLHLLLSYLKRQSNNLLEDCLAEQSMLRSDSDLDIQKYYYEHEGKKSGPEVEKLALAAVKHAGKEYTFLKEVVYNFLWRLKPIAEKAYRDFRESNSFILSGISDEAMSADVAIERIGELLYLSSKRFDKVMRYAENAVIDDNKPQGYTRPKLTVQQVIILFNALKQTGGISPDITNKALGHHISMITGYSAKKLSPNFSNVIEFINENKNGRDADDAQNVKDYLQRVIKAIDSDIK